MSYQVNLRVLWCCLNLHFSLILSKIWLCQWCFLAQMLKKHNFSQLILWFSPSNYHMNIVVFLRNEGASKNVKMKFHFQLRNIMVHSNCCFRMKILKYGSKWQNFNLVSDYIHIYDISLTKCEKKSYIRHNVNIFGQKWLILV